MTTESASASQWVAIGFGALDMSASMTHADTSLILLPIVPSDPIGLNSTAAALWRKLVLGPIPDSSLTADERLMLMEFCEFGIASSNATHPHRITSLTSPWLESYQHELVYALVGSLMRELSLEGVFIKGPMLAAQGLRDRKHSGDVDVWVDSCASGLLREKLSLWGWQDKADIWHSSTINHSKTLIPSQWGCEIDIHSEFPGIPNAENEALQKIVSNATKMPFGSACLSVADKVDNSIIAALHAIRPLVGQVKCDTDFDSAVDVLRRAGSEVYDRCLALMTVEPLFEVLITSFPEIRITIGTATKYDWGWRSSTSRASAYLKAVNSLPHRERFRVALALIWPSDSVARQSEWTASGRSTVMPIVKLKRLYRGIRDYLTSRQL